LNYLYGNYNIISNNYVENATETAPYRVHGSFNDISNNIAVNCKGGVQVTDGHNNTIIGNSLKDCAQAGISVQDAKGGMGVSNTKIENNLVTGKNHPSAIDGIMVYSSFENASNISISGNTVIGFRNADQGSTASSIRLQAVSPYVIYNSSISNNKCSDKLIGISTIRCRATIVDNNTVDGSNYGIYVRDSEGVKVTNNNANSITQYAWGLFGNNTNISFLNNVAVRSVHTGIYGFAKTSDKGHFDIGNQYLQ
jgi:parallel beta-helix repeat protein